METTAAPARARLLVLSAVWYGTHGSPEAAVSAGGVPELSQGVRPVAGIWTDTSSTPPWLQRHCDTVWTSHTGAYKLPYRVDFTQGLFRWWAPKIGAGHQTEVGVGAYLSPLKTITRADGSWETGYFGANRFTPDDMQGTNCCCEYVGQAGPDQPTVLADYFLAKVPGSWGVSMSEACAPYVQDCPADNATAAKKFGDPFIEVYSPCEHFGESAWQLPWAVVMALGVALLSALGLLLLVVKCRSKQSGEDDLSKPFLRLNSEEKGGLANFEKPRRSLSRCSAASTLPDISRKSSRHNTASSVSGVARKPSLASVASTYDEVVRRDSARSTDSEPWSPVV